MNYGRIYEKLILRGKQRVPQGYVERHHIVPKCMGGSDETDNLVVLTPEEHFLAHVLLVKMYPEQTGLILAVQKMCQGKERSRNKMYGWLKRRFSEEMKRSQTGSGNSQHGSFWISNGLESRKIRGDIPEGWWRGRVCVVTDKMVEAGRMRRRENYALMCSCGQKKQPGARQCSLCSRIARRLVTDEEYIAAFLASGGNKSKAMKALGLSSGSYKRINAIVENLVYRESSKLSVNVGSSPTNSTNQRG